PGPPRRARAPRRDRPRRAGAESARPHGVHRFRAPRGAGRSRHCARSEALPCRRAPPGRDGRRSRALIQGLERRDMSTETNRPKSVAAQYFALILAVSVGLPWAYLFFFGTHPSELVTAVMTGTAILGAAFLLSWGVEVAEMDLPTAL